MKLHLISLGCAKNHVDNEIMLGPLGQAGSPTLRERLTDGARQVWRSATSRVAARPVTPLEPPR